MGSDDAAMLARLDAYLDDIVAAGRAEIDGLDLELAGTARRVHAAPVAPTPDPAFARRLRRSLLQKEGSAMIGAGASRIVGAEAALPARTDVRGRWWPRIELAGMVAVVLLLAVVMAGGGWGRSWLRGSGGGTSPVRLIAPSSSPLASTPSPGTPGVALATPGQPVASAGAKAAILFLVDKSGSMSYDPLGGMSKLEMEKETLRRAVAAAPGGTTIGVIGFNDQQQWVVPLTTIGAETIDADRQEIVDAIDGIVAEGGSEFTPALRMVGDMLRGGTAPSGTYVVLLSDGKSRDADIHAYRAVIELMVRAGATFSTIAVGDDADTETMRLMAEYGHGRYHLVVRPEDIPTLVVRDGTLTIEATAATPTA